MNKFKGIFPALVTPYTKDGAVNEYSLRRIVRLGMERECAGFYVGGSTAEAFILSMEERKTILDIVADEVSGRATITIIFTLSERRMPLNLPSMEKG